MQKLSKNDIDDIYNLMQLSFPIDEYRNKIGQLRLFDEENYNVYGLVEDALKGFIAVWELEKYIFIEHFAVNPKSRNHGLGTKMLNELKSICNKPLMLEVEIPEDEIQKRRIAFYERNGFTLNRYYYVQPSLGCGEKPLLIMTTSGCITQRQFDDLKQEIYKKVYKI